MMTRLTTWLHGAILAAGLGLTGVGLYGLLQDPVIADPSGVLLWAVDALVLHDGLWVPLLCLVGALVARGPALRGWLVVAVSVTAVALPAVLRSGADSGNPTLLPLPYLRNWLLLLAATAVLALLTTLARRWRHRSDPVRRRGRPEDRW
ncbi:hypothetical protein ABZW30_36855 [Kitasatospora sp. NPDC004669]|uniref:hypothetical protein n=1 Tax=Kitasatospora sp. NPDC004669 TaxID=3154555 RepID=UPI0033B654D2